MYFVQKLGANSAGITEIEPKITKNFSNFGSSDIEIIKNISKEIFK